MIVNPVDTSSFTPAQLTAFNNAAKLGSGVPTYNSTQGTTLAQDQAKAANQGNTGYDVLGNSIQPPKTVTSFSSDSANQYTADNKTKLASYQNAGVGMDANGYATGADGKAAEAPSSAIANETGGFTDPATGINYYLKGMGVGQISTDPTFQRLYDEYSALKANMDATGAAQIKNIQDQFANLIKQQGDINTRGEASLNQTLTMGGSNRYAQISSNGQMTSMMSYGLQQIAELNQKEQSAVIQAQQAIQNNDMEMLDRQMGIADEARKERQTTAANLSKKLVDQANNTKLEQQKTKDKVNQIAMDAQKNGASPNMVAKIQAATSEGEAIAAAGDSLMTATGDAGAYLFEKRMAERNGQVAPDYTTWTAALEKQKLDSKMNELRMSEGIKFNYAVALDKAKNQISNASNPDYHGEFAATIKLAAQAGGTNVQRQQIANDLQDFIAQGDYKSAYTQILSSANSKLTGANASNFQQQTQQYDALNDMDKALIALKNTGYDTNILKGGLNNIQTKIGALYTNPKYAAVATQVDMAFQNYRLNMTGAAFGVKESAEYASVMPNSGNTFSLNTAKIQGAKAYLDSVTNSVIRNTVGEGGIYIKQYAQASDEARNVQQDRTDKMTTFRADPKNEEMVQEMHSQFPNWTLDQISEALGI